MKEELEMRENGRGEYNMMKRKAATCAIQACIVSTM